MRGYKIEVDFNESPLKTKIREEMVNKLAEEWNKIHNQMERLSWRERDEIDDEADFHSEIAEEAAANAVSFALKENPSLSAEEQEQIAKKEKADAIAEVERKVEEQEQIAKKEKADAIAEVERKVEEQEQIALKEKADYYAEVERKANEPYLRLEVIEELLSDLGARMMRPYEHWNEDERYMEYMENRYDSYGDY